MEHIRSFASGFFIILYRIEIRTERNRDVSEYNIKQELDHSQIHVRMYAYISLVLLRKFLLSPTQFPHSCPQLTLN